MKVDGYQWGLSEEIGLVEIEWSCWSRRHFITVVNDARPTRARARWPTSSCANQRCKQTRRLKMRQRIERIPRSGLKLPHEKRQHERIKILTISWWIRFQSANKNQQPVPVHVSWAFELHHIFSVVRMQASLTYLFGFRTASISLRSLSVNYIAKRKMRIETTCALYSLQDYVVAITKPVIFENSARWPKSIQIT